MTFDLFAALDRDPLDRRHIQRRRQEVENRIQQRLDALVLERGAARYWRNRAIDRCGAQRSS